ncbi:MAG: hypothetical protein Q4F10_04760 [Corynebacterium glutamicum]|nr:hypothetical protein [Corynebacterium glutamicum]
MEDQNIVEDQNIEEVAQIEPEEVETVSEGLDPNETPSDDDQVFDKKYVSKLRKESEGYRKKAKRADDLEKQLHTALVKLDGRLADPEDLEFDVEHLGDGDKLAEAVADLITRKPGLKKQQLSGDVGAGKRGVEKGPSMDLIEIIKGL